MTTLARPAAFGLALCSVIACRDNGNLTQPSAGAASRVDLAQTAAPGTTRQISLHDACDPTTFNAASILCTRQGGVRLDQFNELLEKHHSVGAWHFAPSVANAQVGDLLVAVNRGGEVHTFTEVEEFGGGIVPDLNERSGNPVAAPECLALQPGDFIPPGGTATDPVEGSEKYQCCIHPWMRLTVNAR
jgi:hypothetical protein